MKYLYKYPQQAYPYEQIVISNRQRSRHDAEFELIDTGIFNDDRYFDVFVEYAKGAPEDLLIRISVANRGKEAAKLDLLPTLWFRNTWSWSHRLDRTDRPAYPAVRRRRSAETARGGGGTADAIGGLKRDTS